MAGRDSRTFGGDVISASHMGEQMKFGKHYMVKFFVIWIVFIPLCSVSLGINSGFGQDSKAHGKQKNHTKEMAMADTDKLTEDEGKYLLSVARRTIEQRLLDQKEQPHSDADLSAKFIEPRGTFVTLTTGGNLRGCIGHIIPQESLIEGIRVNAVNAAFRDPRFPPLTKNEWKRVSVEVSILTEPKSLAYSGAADLLKKLRPDIDGVIIKKGYHQATFLPQVWEQLPKKEQFLTHLCLKAGLGADAWKDEDLEVSVYQVQAFEEE